MKKIEININIVRIVCLIFVVTGIATAAEMNNNMNVYVGTYTKGTDSEGIYRFSFDLETGKAGEVKAAAEIQDPSFLAVHPNLKYLYAVSETAFFKGKKTGSVSAFSVDKESGNLTLLNQQSSGGAGPCQLIVDSAGKNVLLANYTAGSFEVLPLLSDGSLGEPSCLLQQKDPAPGVELKTSHCHSINLDLAERYAIVADLGLDRVFFYRFDSGKGQLSPNEPASLFIEEKAGPRHFAWHPSGRFGYIINELNSTITLLLWDGGKGTLSKSQTLSTIPLGFTGKNYCSEVQVHPSGKFLYGSNRGHDSIAIFAIEAETGRLTALGQEATQGEYPRNFCIEPTGQFLLAANQNSDNIVIFRIDKNTGLLKATGQKVEVLSPVCIKFLPGR
ncbi:MAG: lactonase family protein [Candidatus Firestonebacteria bacterium]